MQSGALFRISYILRRRLVRKLLIFYLEKPDFWLKKRDFMAKLWFSGSEMRRLRRILPSQYIAPSKEMVKLRQ